MALYKTIFIYNEKTKETSEIEHFKYQIQSIKCSLDGLDLISGEIDGFIKLFDI